MHVATGTVAEGRTKEENSGKLMDAANFPLAVMLCQCSCCGSSSAGEGALRKIGSNAGGEEQGNGSGSRWMSCPIASVFITTHDQSTDSIHGASSGEPLEEAVGS